VTPDRVLELLQQVADGTARPEAALERLAWLPIEAVGAEGDAAFARLDHHRALRVGHPEVVFGAGRFRHRLRLHEKRAEDAGLSR